MNYGALGIPANVGVGMYLSPWVPIARYAAATRYRIPHPFRDVPCAARMLLRCMTAQNQMTPLMVWQGCSLHYQGGGDWASLILAPFYVDVCMGSTGVFRMSQAATNLTLVPTAGLWEAALMVLG